MEGTRAYRRYSRRHKVDSRFFTLGYKESGTKGSPSLFWDQEREEVGQGEWGTLKRGRYRRVEMECLMTQVRVDSCVEVFKFHRHHLVGWVGRER